METWLPRVVGDIDGHRQIGQRGHDEIDRIAHHLGSHRNRDARIPAESQQAIGARLFISPRAVEKHVTSIFTKLRLPAAREDHRRVLAVLRFLGS